jgi:catechol 2,3-dioxygenase-like lactoylglutathione lyase family enzyme
VIHHVELWVPDIVGARRSWGWLLGELGWTASDEGGAAFSLERDGTYVFVEQSPALSGDTHDRRAPGVNHLAFHAGPRARLDAIVTAAPGYGWTLLFPDRHPYAGGPQHYAAYLEDSRGYEVELVADPA